MIHCHDCYPLILILYFSEPYNIIEVFINYQNDSNYQNIDFSKLKHEMAQQGNTRKIGLAIKKMWFPNCNCKNFTGKPGYFLMRNSYY